VLLVVLLEVTKLGIIQVTTGKVIMGAITVVVILGLETLVIMLVVVLPIVGVELITLAVVLVNSVTLKKKKK
jgi:hypothetical protein